MRDGVARPPVKRAFPAALAVMLVLSIGCSHGRTEPPTAQASPTPPASTVAASLAADIGAPAPDFVLKDVDGREVRLSALRGKPVVLEWFNPKCPFVNKSHTSAMGALKGTAARHSAEGVVWLGIDSSAPGKQGHDLGEIREAATRFGLTHPILLDESGAVGRAYGATNTPHMFVIDRNGTLVYGGAADNSPDGEGESPQGGTLVNYVDAALADLAAEHPVRVPRTKAYGCSVKYGS
jgi:peroxiredoxin